MIVRKVNRIIKGQHVMEGAGVKLKRIFGFYEKNLFDPFLLLDNFGSDNPQDYMAGFPWHPHRGMETVTYMLEGQVEHGDSIGNSGIISSGDVQWMTAGSGIIHQEMPKRYQGNMRGFQLWVNLPASKKMMKPRYQDVPSSVIPVTEISEGVKVKVIAGEINKVTGPVREIVMEPKYFDISLNIGKNINIEVNPYYTVICLVHEGEVCFGDSSEIIRSGEMVHLTDGDNVYAESKADVSKFIFIAGMPLNEKIAWRGPIVMNTDEELNQAFFEYRNGTFIK